MRRGAVCSAAVSLALALSAGAGWTEQSPATIDPSRTAEHLAAAIRFKTISHQEPAEDDRTQFEGFRAFLERTYPKLHRALERELVNGDSLLYVWKGAEASAKPVLLMAHQDVVPVEPGTEAAWTHPPFDGVIADGFVWGRGAMDDKGALILLLEAVESLVAEGFRPRATTYLAFGHDEEVGGLAGARETARLLERRGIRLAYVLDEGRSITQGIVPDVAEPIASIGVAEKGYVSLELTFETEGGHSSRPPPESSIGVMAAAIERIERKQMPARLRGPPREELERLAPLMPASRRWVLSNLWLTRPFVLRGYERNPTTNALVRTTTAPTIFQSGVKENVLPSKARAVVNFRILAGDSVAGVVEHVREVVDDDRVAVTKLERVLSEPSPESSTEGPAYELLSRTIHEVFPDVAATTPSLVVGATDSRHFIPVADDVYRFMPIRIGPADLRRVHGTDERLAVGQIPPAVEFYRRLLRASGSPPRPR